MAEGSEGSAGGVAPGDRDGMTRSDDDIVLEEEWEDCNDRDSEDADNVEDEAGAGRDHGG